MIVDVFNYHLREMRKICNLNINKLVRFISKMQNIAIKQTLNTPLIHHASNRMQYSILPILQIQKNIQWFWPNLRDVRLCWVTVIKWVGCQTVNNCICQEDTELVFKTTSRSHLCIDVQTKSLTSKAGVRFSSHVLTCQNFLRSECAMCSINHCHLSPN